MMTSVVDRRFFRLSTDFNLIAMCEHVTGAFNYWAMIVQCNYISSSILIVFVNGSELISESEAPIGNLW